MNYKEGTIKSYEKHAPYFSEHFKDLLDSEKDKFLHFLKGRKLLDLGCGSGDYAMYFKDKGLGVTCIDLSEEMIRICKNKGLNAKAMDMESLEFENNSFGGIWAVTSLLHIPKDRIKKVIKRLSEILK